MKGIFNKKDIILIVEYNVLFKKVLLIKRSNVYPPNTLTKF